MDEEHEQYRYECELCGHRLEGPSLERVVARTAEHERAHTDGHVALSEVEMAALREQIALAERTERAGEEEREG